MSNRFVSAANNYKLVLQVLLASKHSSCSRNFFFAEITAFSDRYEEFKTLNTEVLGVSVDSVVRNFPASNSRIALQVVITLIFINDE